MRSHFYFSISAVNGLVIRFCLALPASHTLFFPFFFISHRHSMLCSPHAILLLASSFHCHLGWCRRLNMFMGNDATALNVYIYSIACESTCIVCTQSRKNAENNWYSQENLLFSKFRWFSQRHLEIPRSVISAIIFHNFFFCVYWKITRDLECCHFKRCQSQRLRLFVIQSEK